MHQDVVKSQIETALSSPRTVATTGMLRRDMASLAGIHYIRMPFARDRLLSLLFKFKIHGVVSGMLCDMFW
jgi:hypothetical protein